MMKTISLLIVVFFFTISSFAQNHFVLAFSDIGQDHMNINVVSATINGVALQAGDEIATFDGSICCSKSILTKPIVFTDKNSFALLAASKSDVNESNGYTAGNVISFRIWDSDKKMELSGVTAEFISPVNGQAITAPKYSPGETAFVKLSAVVSDTNKTPVPKAGEDQSVNEGDKVSLNGSGSSDEDGDALSYYWTSPAGIILNSTTVANPTFDAPDVKADTEFSFFLIVSDGTINSAPDEVVVKVKHINKTPVANAGVDQKVEAGDIVSLDGSASFDSDGDLITYKWISHPGITLSSTTAVNPAFIAPGGVVFRPYTFILVVNDGMVNSIADTVQITVELKNRPPVANAGSEQILDENSVCVLDGTGSSDPDGNTLTYLWTPPAGITLNQLTASKPTLTLPEIKQDTVLNFSLVVNDGIVNSEPSTVKVYVLNVIKTSSEDISVNNIKVYPNPSDGFFRIDGLNTKRTNNFEIYSADGKLLSRKKSNSVFENFDISGQPNGKYLLFVNSKPYKIQKM